MAQMQIMQEKLWGGGEGGDPGRRWRGPLLMHPTYPSGRVPVHFGRELFRHFSGPAFWGPLSHSLGERRLGAGGGYLGKDMEGAQTQASYLSRLTWLRLFGREKASTFDACPGGRGRGPL